MLKKSSKILWNLYLASVLKIEEVTVLTGQNIFMTLTFL